MPDHTSGEIQSVDTLLNSTLDSVDTAENAVLEVGQAMGFVEDDLHALGMAVRECMVNAIVHGNRYNVRKKVHFAVFRGPDHIKIVIGDEGEGFDLKSLPDPLAEENLLRQSGRGLLLMQAFVDEFELRRREPSGTEVQMVKYLANARD